jgi:hypothetical protein
MFGFFVFVGCAVVLWQALGGQHFWVKGGAF